MSISLCIDARGVLESLKAVAFSDNDDDEYSPMPRVRFVLRVAQAH